MIRDTTVVNAGRKDVTDLEIKKPYTLFQCNNFMKGIDRADKYLLLLGSEENCQMAEYAY